MRAKADLIVSTGIENPSPCAMGIIAVVMPTTRPLLSTSGPPEFPGLMEVSVWMSPVIFCLPGPGSVRSSATFDSGRDRPVQAVGVAHGDDQLPDAQRSAAQFCHGQVIGANAQQSDVDVWITANHTGVKRASIRQRHLHALCIGHHVGVGQDLSIGGKDET